MKLYSTNNKDLRVDFKEAVLNSLPKDKGLYMPLEIPRLPENFFENLKNLSFQEIAFIVSKNIIGNSIHENDLDEIIDDAINFDAPVVRLDEQIYCLVRNPARMPLQNDRIHLITGDLTQKHFGLTETEWHTLSDKIDRIYHCAAWVNIVQDYDTLRPANITGTQEVLRFACTGLRKHIHYASTLSVFVATDQNSGTLLETDRLENTQYVYGGYAQTKWAAEYLLLQVPEDACAITHYRFGLITGDTKTGTCTESDFLKMFVEGVTSLGIIPDGFDDKLHIDITPVDYAVAAFFHLSQNGTHDIYHIANPKSLSLGRLIDAIGTVQKCPADDWKNHFKNKTLSSTESATYLALCRCLDNFENYRTMDLFQATNVVFDTTQAQADYPVTCPAPTDDLLQTYLDFILKQKTGRTAA